MALMPYTKQWQAHHRVLITLLSPSMSKRYRYLQDIESKQAIHELLASNDFSQSFIRYTTSLKFTLAYGLRLEHSDRPDISEMRYVINCLLDAMKNITVAAVGISRPWIASPGSWPRGSGFGEQRHMRTISFLLKNLKYAQSTSTWNWVREIARLKEAQLMPEEEVAYLIGTIHEGRIETTPTALRTAIKALVLHTAVAQRAQREIDKVIGLHRLPAFDDMSHLPYLNAVLKETLRWQPLLTLGVPHSPITDDEYMGFCIPHGSVILQNNHARGIVEDTRNSNKGYNLLIKVKKKRILYLPKREDYISNYILYYIV